MNKIPDDNELYKLLKENDMIKENLDLLKILFKCGAILSGYFKLSSGRLSTTYIQGANLQKYPYIYEKLFDIFVKKIQKNLSENVEIDYIIGPAVGGIIPAYELTRSFIKSLDIENFLENKIEDLKPKTLIADKNTHGFELRRYPGLEIKNKNFIICEDVVTTGGSFKKVANYIKNFGGNVLCVTALIDRTSGASQNFDDKFISLLKLQIKSYESEEELPEDLKGKVWTKLGSIV